ncbi:MAG: RusA family crossover junction endodeoxyribonuclease [Gallionella sp.]|nr:RusA family crossover junction endodeoxyribonuclease [Gallionella sp.]
MTRWFTNEDIAELQAKMKIWRTSGKITTHRLGNEGEVAGIDRRAARPPRQGANKGRAVPQGRVDPAIAPNALKQAVAVLLLPYPPSVNHYWLLNCGGGRRICDAGKRFRLAVQLIMNRSGVESMPGRLSVEIIASPPDKRRRDVDNLLKAILDALQHAGLYADDNAIDVLKICRGDVIKGGSLLVKVERALDLKR